MNSQITLNKKPIPGNYFEISLQYLKKLKQEYNEKIDDLFKPLSKMTLEEIEQAINDPHYISRKADEYHTEIRAIERAERELLFLINRKTV